jgi:mono/diheme cytochrome c family protein
MIRPSLLPILSAAVVLLAGSAAIGAEEQQKPYNVENGHVDINTFHGYLFYGEACLRCHGPDGAGSSYAPSLVDSLKQMTEHQFKDVVINGRQNVNTGSTNVMPSFGLVADVVEHLDDIYAYLKGRSDGVIGRGRPQRIDEQ